MWKPAVKFEMKNYAAFFALLGLVVISSFLSPHFMQLQNILNITRQISYTGIIALGMTFVIIVGGIDLSVGSIVPFVSCVGIIILNNSIGIGMGEAPAILLLIATSLGLGLFIGWLNGVLITKGGIEPFIVTLGSMAIYRSLALFIGDAGEVRSVSAAYGDMGMNAFLKIPVPTLVMFALAYVMSLILAGTRYGRHLCAVGSSNRVSEFSAINVHKVKIIAFSVSGFCAAVSGVLLSSRFNAVSTSNMGLSFELDAIAAVIIGGTPMSGGRGSIWGTIIGAALLGVINNMLNMLGISPYLQGLVKGLVIVLTVLLQRQKSEGR